MYGKIAIAAASLATVASAAPKVTSGSEFINGTGMSLNAPTAKMGALAVSDSYTMYYGNGSPEAGWPAIESWGTFDELWAVNSAVMPQTCGWNGFAPENSAQEISDIYNAILQVSGETGVDARFILGVIMQESKGCVRVWATNNGVHNPGLMQSHNGLGSCEGVSPCPYDTILLMIRDGTAGTASGDGLRQTLDHAVAAYGSSSAQAHYAAAREYNSGSVDYNDLNNGFTSTACYATDVANRMTGWILAATGCWL